MAAVTLERGPDGVRVLMLDDPERRNALGHELGEALAVRIAEVRADPAARVLVIGGRGSAFCAGADLPEVFGDPDRPVAEIRALLHDYYERFLGLAELTIPTIAAVQGPAIGAGMNLALVCDVRFAGPEARFGVTFSRIGLHPGGGATSFLVRALGPQRALRVILEGRVLGPEEALAGGLVDEIADDPLSAALGFARRAAELEPELVSDVKRCVGIAVRDGFAAALEFESWAQASSATGPRIREAVERFRR